MIKAPKNGQGEKGMVKQCSSSGKHYFRDRPLTSMLQWCKGNFEMESPHFAIDLYCGGTQNVRAVWKFFPDFRTAATLQGW